MKALVLVVGFWAGVAAVAGWAVVLVWAIDVEMWSLVVPLVFVPVLALSLFLWFAFAEVV